MRHAWLYERALHGLQSLEDAEKVDRVWKSLSPQERQALALKPSLEQSTAIPNPPPRTP